MSFSCTVSFWEEKRKESITFPNCTRTCLVKKSTELRRLDIGQFHWLRRSWGIKLYAKKNESNNQAKKRTFSCGKSRGARLAHLDHSSSQSECRICLILPTCGFSHTIIRRRTRTIIYLLFVFASLCSLASLWRWGVTTKTAWRIKSSFPSKEKQRTTWQWWTAGEKIFLACEFQRTWNHLPPSNHDTWLNTTIKVNLLYCIFVLWETVFLHNNCPEQNSISSK